MGDKFYRIYWSKKFNWKEYSRLYDKYCKTGRNYYNQSSEALINSVNIKEDSLVVDLACGTGSLTQVLLKKFPKIRIMAIDISKEAIEHYKNNFKEQIQKKQIKVIQGNAENINKYITKRPDLIFIASSLWDMKLDDLFENLPKIMTHKTKIVTNLPCLTVKESKGFIYDIEHFFEKELKIRKLYRKIPIQKLKQLSEKNNLRIQKKKRYEFMLSKNNIKLFFGVLKYRYPFIFFSESIPYKERYQKCSLTFDRLLKTIPEKGLKEQGYVIVIGEK